MPTLVEQMNDYVNAGFAGLWIQTSEPDEAEREIHRQGASRRWRVLTWDVSQGLRAGDQPAVDSGGDPLAALRALPALNVAKQTTLLLRSCPFSDGICENWGS